MNYGDLERSVNDVQGALARMQVLQVLASDDVSQNRLQAIIDQSLNSSSTPARASRVWYNPADAGVPRWALALIPGSSFLYLFIGGCAGNTQGTDCWAGYTGNFFGITSIVENGTQNPWFINAANLILTNPTQPFAFEGWQTKPVIISGHSAGGCVGAYVFFSLLGTKDPSVGPPLLVTFGSPSPGDYAVLTRFAGTQQASWFLSDDPVPLIPPPLNFAQRWWGGLTFGQANRIGRFIRWGAGIEVDLSGRVLPSTLPDQVGPDPVSAVQNWLGLTAAGVQTSHSPDTYVARLTLAQPPANQPAIPVTPVMPVTRVPVPTRRQVAQQIADATQTIFANGLTNNSVPVSIPEKESFSVVKTGRVYYVYFRGVVVGVGPHKRGAHQTARDGNAFLKSMQNRAGIDTAALVSEFENYLADASDPTQGFKPVMIDGV